ncbi:MAG TPA: hypothetical protein VHM19_18110 [Polyangiales bacterium]|jgi:Spy/CpxP family protein refolding chaperone|nr:hypothetical protein [Polyangiales bacterium]
MHYAYGCFHPFGFGFALLGLFLLFGLLRHRRWHRYHAHSHGFGYGYGPGFGPGYYGYGHGSGPDCGPHGHGHHGGFGFGRRFARFGFRGGMLRYVLARLDTTPGQEKAIRAALEELGTRLSDLRKSAKGTRRSLALAFSAQEWNRTAADATFAEQVELLKSAQRDFADALARIHEALDEKQRQQLAELIEDGF